MVLEQRDLSRMLETAIVAARLGGQRAMEELSFIKVSIKNNSELVTQADAQCQQIIINRIKETYPDHGFIAEEGDQRQDIQAAPARGRAFLVGHRPDRRNQQLRPPDASLYRQYCGNAQRRADCRRDF